MPAVDDPFGIAASLPGQLKTVKDQIKDLASNNTQAVSQALAAASAASAAAAAATVTGAVAHAISTSFALSTTPSEIVRATIVVPAGYTQALVFASSSMTVVNNSASGGDIVHGYVDINGNAGPASGGTFVNISVPSSLSVSYGFLCTGLTGGSSFYIRAVYYNEAGATGGTAPRNMCNVDGIITYLH